MRKLLALALLAAATVVLPSPAHADLQVAQGTITTSATPGTPVSVTGLSFQPKALILMTEVTTSAVDGSGGGPARLSLGFAAIDGDETTYGVGALDGSSPNTNTGTGNRQSDCIILVTQSAGHAGYASCTLNSDGFTLTPGSGFSSTYVIHYLALGGSDITNAKVGYFLTGTTSGDKDITTIDDGTTAIGFQPDTAFFISTNRNTFGSGSDASISFGWAAGATPVSGMCGWASDSAVATTNTWRYCRSGDAIGSLSVTGSAISYRAPVTSWLSGGFRVNFATAPTSRYVHFLAIKGAQFKVGDFLTSTSGTTVVTGLGFQPKAIIIQSHTTTQSTAGTSQSGAEFSLGWSTGVGVGQAIGGLDEDNVAAPSQAAFARDYNDLVYLNLSTSDTLEGTGSISAISSDGFTVDFTANPDPAQAFALFWAIGPTAVGGGGGAGSGMMLRGMGK